MLPQCSQRKTLLIISVLTAKIQFLCSLEDCFFPANYPIHAFYFFPLSGVRRARLNSLVPCKTSCSTNSVH